MHGIVLFAHGARDPDWARPFEAIRDRIRATRPECPIELAYLEFMAPTLEQAVERLVEARAAAVTIFPLFMSQGAHLRQDLPALVAAIRSRHPHVPVALEKALGDSPELIDAIAGWVMTRLD